MKATEIHEGQAVVVKTREGQFEGVISYVSRNLCTFETECEVDYQKDGRTWTMMGVPVEAIEKK